MDIIDHSTKARYTVRLPFLSMLIALISCKSSGSFLVFCDAHEKGINLFAVFMAISSSKREYANAWVNDGEYEDQMATAIRIMFPFQSTALPTF